MSRKRKSNGRKDGGVPGSEAGRAIRSQELASIPHAEFDARTATPEQVEAYLRSEGLDPDEEREHGRKVIERLKAEIAAKKEKPWHPSCPRYPSDGPCNCG